MTNTLLNINKLTATVEEKNILKGLDLTINKGEIHVIMGPNGAGKSTLANVIMGHPKYKVNDGEMNFEGESLIALKTDERAKKGIFLSFQNPEEVPGVTVTNFIRTAKTAVSQKPVSLFSFNIALEKKMESLNMDKRYGERYLNVGFSGGEKKKNEILQMLTLDPKLAILDETDSGLDVDAVKIVSEGIRKFKNDSNAILIITHNSKVLDSITPDYVHILVDGKIVKTGDATLADEIDREGYGKFIA